MKPFVCLALFVLLAPWLAYSQDVRGMVLGTVTDPQGAALAGARVTFSSTDGQQWWTTTNSTGLYTQYLYAGTYHVVVTAANFANQARTVEVRSQSPTQLDVMLYVAGNPSSGPAIYSGPGAPPLGVYAQTHSPFGISIIHFVPPKYPRLALVARIQGDVFIRVFPGGGSVMTAQAISGHPMLRDAAVDAVKQWRLGYNHSNSDHDFVVTIAFVIDSAQSCWSGDGPAYWSLPELPSRVTVRGRVPCVESKTTCCVDPVSVENRLPDLPVPSLWAEPRPVVNTRH